MLGRIVIVLLVLASSDSELLSDSDDMEYRLYQVRVKILAELVHKECPGLDILQRPRRQSDQTDAQVEKLLYQHMKEKLRDCRSLNTTKQPENNIGTSPNNIGTSPNNNGTSPYNIDTSPNNIGTSPYNIDTSPNNIGTRPNNIGSTTEELITHSTGLTTSPSKTTIRTTKLFPPKTAVPTTTILTHRMNARITTRTLSTVATTTVPAPVAKECRDAHNFTEYWRRDNKGQAIDDTVNWRGRIRYFDLTKVGRWFRFTGEAGNRMLDSCPSAGSCGSADYDMWSDSMMPISVGNIIQVKLWGSNSHGGCKAFSRKMSVMRCSKTVENDFIYRDDSESNPKFGKKGSYCGMV